MFYPMWSSDISSMKILKQPIMLAFFDATSYCTLRKSNNSATSVTICQLVPVIQLSKKKDKKQTFSEFQIVGVDCDQDRKMCLRQSVTGSLFQFSRREREFLSRNLVLRDDNKNFILQSRAPRRERESRLRQFSQEFSGITFIACFFTDIFKKRLLISQNFLR